MQTPVFRYVVWRHRGQVGDAMNRTGDGSRGRLLGFGAVRGGMGWVERQQTDMKCAMAFIF
ncbi:hypothetical protein DI041_02280 [Stenotrophomonas maltophilia]|nr:hypothetical protein DI034_07205 [Stenotrophomonas maltophilia]TIE64853.1 hypothetical protein DI041_02280 [Stenotrophomonas maltophilia]